MTNYSKDIASRADVLRFFIHLQLDLKRRVDPDTHFEEWAPLTGHPPTVDLPGRQEIDNTMKAARRWCTEAREDIYEAALQAGLFKNFLKSHRRIEGKEQMLAFGRKYIGKGFILHDNMRAFHLYAGKYYIEEFMHEGKVNYQCITSDNDPWGKDLRHIEVELFECYGDRVSPRLRQKR